MIIKHLSQSGNSSALFIDKALLKAAGLGEDSLFSIIINPNGGLTIQSVEPTHKEIKNSAFRKILEENREVLKRLADR